MPSCLTAPVPDERLPLSATVPVGVARSELTEHDRESLLAALARVPDGQGRTRCALSANRYAPSRRTSAQGRVGSIGGAPWRRSVTWRVRPGCLEARFRRC